MVGNNGIMKHYRIDMEEGLPVEAVFDRFNCDITCEIRQSLFVGLLRHFNTVSELTMTFETERLGFYSNDDDRKIETETFLPAQTFRQFQVKNTRLVVSFPDLKVQFSCVTMLLILACFNFFREF